LAWANDLIIVGLGPIFFGLLIPWNDDWRTTSGNRPSAGAEAALAAGTRSC
jgi:hypothetical protein